MKAAGISDFTSDRARARFHAAYRHTLARRWPHAEAVTVSTSYGDAVAYRFGPERGTPVVLLPGSGGNALAWIRYADRLAERHPVLALDPVGEPGAARQTAPITTGLDAVRCLHETLDALRVPRAHLVGMSYGGWLALRHEQHFPGRAARLVLLDPAGFGTVSTRFVLWVLACGLTALAPGPLRRFLAGPLGNTVLRDEELMGLVRAAGLSFRRRMPAATPLTDAELTALTVPSLILLGERSQLYPARDVAARIGALLPHARTEIVPGAGHDLPVHSPELVADRIDAFLTAAGTQPA